MATVTAGTALIADGAHAYFTEGSTIWRVAHLPLDGGAPPGDADPRQPVPFAIAAGRPSALAVGPRHVAWSAAGAIWITAK